jgi:hypothetical protein
MMRRLSAVLLIVVVVSGLRFVACPGEDAPDGPSARDEFVIRYARARAAAVQYDRVARLCIEAAAGRFWVEVDTGVPGAAMADTIGRVVDLSAEHPDVEMTAEVDTLCFDAEGLAYVAGACDPHGSIVTFSHRGGVDTVQLSPGGTVIGR